MMPHPCMFRSIHLMLRVVLAAVMVTLASCGDSRKHHTVYPVKGKILVNGQPVEDCRIVLNRTYEDEHPIVPTGITAANGEFQITSYANNDGAPEGEYIATITWPERSGVVKENLDGPDQLGGVYANIEKTKGLPGFVIKVEKQPLELPPFELKQSSDLKRRMDAMKKRKSASDLRGPLGGSDR